MRALAIFLFLMAFIALASAVRRVQDGGDAAFVAGAFAVPVVFGLAGWAALAWSRRGTGTKRRGEEW